MWYIIVGILSGVLGSMGMGGGTILIPILITFFSMEQKTAQFINLVSFVFMGVIAVILHKKNGLIAFGLGLIFAIFGGVFAFFVSIFSTKLDGQILKNIFGIFLIIVGFCQLITSIKKQKLNK